MYLNTIVGHNIGSMNPLVCPPSQLQFPPLLFPYLIINVSPHLLEVAKTIKSVLATPLNIFLLNTALLVRDPNPKRYINLASFPPKLRTFVPFLP